MPIVTDYIPLAKAAEQMGCIEEDILQLGLMGKVQLMFFTNNYLKWELYDPEEFYSAPYDSPIYGIIYPGFYPLGSEDCANLLIKDGKAKIIAFNDIKVTAPDGVEFLNYCGFVCPKEHGNTFVWVSVLNNHRLKAGGFK